jgi:uncharacterized protein (TIGR02996 family)
MDPFTLAVCENPDDDTPRLVYADWLDEHDDPDRAAFIRLQCELATLADDSPRRREVAYLARQLEDRHAADWAPPDGQVLEYRFARGFVEMVGLTAESLEHERTAVLFGLNPIRRLWVTGMDGDVHALRRCVPRTNSITALDLTGNDLTADSLRDLAGFAHLYEVRELELLFNRLGDEAAAVLCGEAFFQRMQLIRCGANPMTDAGRQRLRDHFGDRVTFAAERDPGRRYAITDEDFSAGTGQDYTQLLLLAGREALRLAVFDCAGNLLGTKQRVLRRVQEGTYHDQRERRRRSADRWFREHQGRLAPVRVRRFRFAENVGIYDFPNGWTSVFDTPDSSEIDTGRRWLRRWLAQGQFAFRFGVGSDWWLDRTGVVTDT